MRLQNKRAVVTGSAWGIGRAIARKFAGEGARVVVADKDVPAGNETRDAIRADGGIAEFVEVDVTQEDAVQRLVDASDAWLGGIDIWVNNAGTGLTEDLLDMPTEAWRADVDLNLTSHFLCARAALPIMIRGGGGSLITISSVNALWSIGEFGYSAAKAAILQFTKNIAVTYGSRGIRANAICPGTIDTESGGAYWDEKIGGKEKIVKWYPVGRLGKAEDVAHAALFFASDESSFVSGATLVVDGGLTAGGPLFGKV
jgi:NAD(P)-dependent dehydrogenase (short-subunit alcohol dehydrogenase family)